MSKIVLCDIDGTIANNDHRQHYLKGKKDWDGFFSELINDEPIFPIINKVIEEHNAGKNIIFLTGRPERYRKSTILWLKRYFNFDLEILMRKDTDRRDKLITKKEMFEQNFDKENIELIIDNDKDLLNMWREMNIATIDANKN